VVKDSPLKLFFSERQALPLPEDHRFPASKYSLLLDRLSENGFSQQFALLQAEPASYEHLLSVHTPDYLDRMLGGLMSDREMRRIGFPWSAALMDRARRSVGGTIAACRAALGEGSAANLGGGLTMLTLTTVKVTASSMMLLLLHALCLMKSTWSGSSYWIATFTRETAQPLFFRMNHACSLFPSMAPRTFPFTSILATWISHYRINAMMRPTWNPSRRVCGTLWHTHALNLPSSSLEPTHSKVIASDDWP